MTKKKKIKLVQIHDDWAFKIDSYNNHMLYEYTKVVKHKGKPEEVTTYEWKHTGSYFNHHKAMIEHLFKILRNREFCGDKEEGLQVPLAEFVARLDGVLEELSKIYDKVKHIETEGK